MQWLTLRFRSTEYSIILPCRIVQSTVLYCQSYSDTVGSRNECKFLPSCIKKDKGRGNFFFFPPSASLWFWKRWVDGSVFWCTVVLSVSVCEPQFWCFAVCLSQYAWITVFISEFWIRCRSSYWVPNITVVMESIRRSCSTLSAGGQHGGLVRL